MTLEDLQEQGVLLPEDEWGEYELTSTVPGPALLALFAIAAASIAVSLIDDGGLLTLVSLGVFILDLFGLTLLLDRSVVRLRARTRSRLRQLGKSGRGRDSEGPGTGSEESDGTESSPAS